MSSGHDHRRPNERHAPELLKLLADPKIIAALKARYRVDRTFDIPYLAGYSKDGSVIYVDRHFPVTQLPITAGRRVNVLRAIVTHERVEKALIDAKGMEYQGAHEFATLGEHDVVTRMGLAPVAYERALKPFIKGAEIEKLQHVPPDLDLTPYEDEHDAAVLRHLQGAQHGQGLDQGRGGRQEQGRIAPQPRRAAGRADPGKQNRGGNPLQQPKGPPAGQPRKDPQGNAGLRE